MPLEARPSIAVLAGQPGSELVDDDDLVRLVVEVVVGLVVAVVVRLVVEGTIERQGIERIVSTVPASGWEPAPTEAPAHEVAALERMQEKLGLAQERREERRSERKTEASRG